MATKKIANEIHITGHIIGMVALLIACFAITGYINFRSESIPRRALDKPLTFDETVTLKGLTVTGISNFTGNTGLTAGTGFSDATLYKSWRSSNGGITKTELLIDLTGIQCHLTFLGQNQVQTRAIIGNNGEKNANIGQYTTAVMGTLFAVNISCIEQPDDDNRDIDLVFTDESTLGEGNLIINGTNSGTLLDNGNLTTGGEKWVFTGFPQPNQYFYLDCLGFGGIFTSGIIKIDFYGTTV